MEVGATVEVLVEEAFVSVVNVEDEVVVWAGALLVEVELVI